MGTAQRNDPLLSFCFQIEVADLVVGGFSEVSGLQSEVETEDYQEGGVNDYSVKLLKPTKYPNFILKRGITDSDTLWKWHQDVRNGKIERKTVNIVLLDSEGNRKRDWRLVEAYPIKWGGPDLKATSGEVAIESLEFVHEGLRID